MSGKIFECGYGAIVLEDAAILESCLEKLCAPGLETTIKVCEIGCHDGGTALGIKRYVESHGCKLEYYGIEPDKDRQQFYWGAGCTIINADSTEVFNKVPYDLDLVWVDGCHCFNHVVLDTLHYAKRVRNFGFMCYHDINPKIQRVGEKQYHGPDIAEFMVCVNDALAAIRFPWAPWELWDQDFPTDQWGCGTAAFRKGRP